MQSSWKVTTARYARRNAERRAQQEQIDEISKGVLANLSKEGSKAAKDIASELQKALKSIKL